MMDPTRNVTNTAQMPISNGGSRLVIGAGIALAITALLILALTIGGELHGPLKDWLKHSFYHHWVGKGVLGAITFIIGIVIGGLVPPTAKRERASMMFAYTMVLVATIALIAFFAYEAFFAH